MTRTQTILIVDDEVTIRDVVRRYLELDGFQVLEADFGSQALALLSHYKPDLVVLDIMLPGLDGFSVTRALRNSSTYALLSATGDDIPIIILTSRSEESDRILGFELGVDDYIVKPFSPRELVHRVRAVLRRSLPGILNTEKPLVFSNLQIDPSRRTVQVSDKFVSLTAKEFDLLWLFARHPQQVFTREQILAQVWGHEFYGDESTVTVHIRRLREKIEFDPGNPAYIQTVWGVGYKFEPA